MLKGVNHEAIVANTEKFIILETSLCDKVIKQLLIDKFGKLQKHPSTDITEKYTVIICGAKFWFTSHDISSVLITHHSHAIYKNERDAKEFALRNLWPDNKRSLAKDDKVLVKSIDECYEISESLTGSTSRANFCEDMERFCGKVYCISEYKFVDNNVFYQISGDRDAFNWHPDYFSYCEKDSCKEVFIKKTTPIPVPLKIVNINNKKGESKMAAKTLKTTALSIFEQNKIGIKHAAKVTVGKAINKNAAKLIIGSLPPMAKVFIKDEDPLVQAVVGNMVAFAIKHFTDNEKANLVADSMINAGSFSLFEKFNIEEMIDKLTAGINLKALTGQAEDEIVEEKPKKKK